MATGLLYLKDILDSLNRISRYSKGFDFERLASNEMVMDAVVRNLQIIGEASKRLPPEIRKKHSVIPWVEMTATGEFLITGYANIDPLTVWDVTVLLLRHVRPNIILAIEMEEIQEEDY